MCQYGLAVVNFSSTPLKVREVSLTQTEAWLAPGSVQLYIAVVYMTAVLLGGGRGDCRTIGINFGVVRGYGNLQNQKKS